MSWDVMHGITTNHLVCEIRGRKAGCLAEPKAVTRFSLSFDFSRLPTLGGSKEVLFIAAQTFEIIEVKRFHQQMAQKDILMRFSLIIIWYYLVLKTKKVWNESTLLNGSITWNFGVSLVNLLIDVKPWKRELSWILHQELTHIKVHVYFQDIFSFIANYKFQLYDILKKAKLLG